MFVGTFEAIEGALEDPGGILRGVSEAIWGIDDIKFSVRKSSLA